MKTVLLVNAVNAASDQNSPVLTLNDLTNYSIHIDFSGVDLAGTLTLESSNDNTDFVTVANSSQSVTLAASHVYDVAQAQYLYVRVAWDYTSGTGTWTARSILKEPIRAAG